MSWQNYVDEQICGAIDCKAAVIAGLADGAIWAKRVTQDKEITQQELKTIIDTMRSNPQSFTEKGVYLGGEKFFALSADSNLIRGRKGSSALSIVATKSSLLVAITIDGFPPGKLNSVLEGLGEYLSNLNF